MTAYFFYNHLIFVCFTVLYEHLYNCTYEAPIVEDSSSEYRRVVGKRVVCRFSITPTRWGAIPSDGVVLSTAGLPPVSKAAAKLPFFSGADDAAADGPEAVKTAGGPQIDDMLAAREKELEALNIPNLRELARERGLKQNGNKTDLIESLLRYEEKKLRGEE